MCPDALTSQREPQNPKTLRQEVPAKSEMTQTRLGRNSRGSTEREEETTETSDNQLNLWPEPGRGLQCCSLEIHQDDNDYGNKGTRRPERQQRNGTNVNTPKAKILYHVGTIYRV